MFPVDPVPRCTYRGQVHDLDDPNGQGQVHDHGDEEEQQQEIEAALPPAVQAHRVDDVIGDRGSLEVQALGPGDVLLLRAGVEGGTMVDVKWTAFSNQW